MRFSVSLGLVWAVSSVVGGLNQLALAGDGQPFTITQLVLEGDSVPGVGTITRIDNLAVNNDGQWLVEADTNAAADFDSVLIRDGKLYLREGDPLDLPIGATLDSFDAVNLNNAGDSGWNFFLDGTKNIFDDSGIYLNANLVLQEGTISQSEDFGPNTPYIGFFESAINNNAPSQILLMASIDDPNIASSVDRALVILTLTEGGLGYTETVIYKEGDVLPGQIEPVADFETGPHDFAFNDDGDVMFIADLTGDTAVDGAVYVNDVLLAQEGSASPVEGRNWFSLSVAVVELNNNGDHAFRGRLDGDTATDYLIVKNGAKLVQEGDVLADTNGAPLTSLSSSGPLRLNDNGEVVWRGAWVDPKLGEVVGLFKDESLIVQEGVTTEEGFLFESIIAGQDGISLSDNGRYMVFEADLPGGLNGAFLLDFGSVCPAGLDCTVGPDDFSAFRGFYNSGDLNSLLESDDDKLCFNPGIVLFPTEAPITLDFVGTLPNDSPASLDVTIESSANTVGLELTISFWNYNTSMWDIVGKDAQSLNADTVRTFAGDPVDHVELGTGEVRTRYEVRVVSFIFLFPWLDCVDHVFWAISG